MHVTREGNKEELDHSDDNKRTRHYRRVEDAQLGVRLVGLANLVGLGVSRSKVVVHLAVGFPASPEPL